jgi:hypothetical protein
MALVAAAFTNAPLPGPATPDVLPPIAIEFAASALALAPKAVAASPRARLPVPIVTAYCLLAIACEPIEML